MNTPDTEMMKLADCPFCGTVPRVDNIGSGQCVRIYCVGVDCTAYPSVRKYANGDALERAVKAWNVRAPVKSRISGDGL